MKPKTYEELEREHAALLSIVQNAQQRERESEMVIKLLITAGHVDEEKIQQARTLASQL